MVHPSLFMSLVRCVRIYFRCDADDPSDITGFGLGSAHATQTCRHEKFSGGTGARFVVHPHGIQNRNGGSMHDALRANVHVRARCHLPVLRNAHRIHPLPIIRFRIIRNDHAVGNDNTWRVFVRRE